MMNSPMIMDSPSLSLLYLSDDDSTTVMNNPLQHLSIQYQSLATEYTAIELENKEYVKYIQTLQQKNVALTEDNKAYKESIVAEKQIKSALSLQMDSYKVALDAIDLQRSQLNQKLNDYDKLIQALTAENHEVIETNQKYKKALENVNKQKQSLQFSSKQQNESNLHRIETLEAENHALKQEIITLKHQPSISEELDDEKLIYLTSPSHSNQIRRIDSVISPSQYLHSENLQETPFFEVSGYESPHYEFEHSNALFVDDEKLIYLTSPSYSDQEYDIEELVKVADDLVIEGLESKLAHCQSEIVKLRMKLKKQSKDNNSTQNSKSWQQKLWMTAFGSHR